MTVGILITLCVLLLIAYCFDLSSRFTRIPSVILLISVGHAMQHILTAFQFQLPDFSSILPLLGTVGLILIVLEGALELHIDASKKPILIKTSLGALLAIVVFTAIITGFLVYFEGMSIQYSILNVIPLSIISSAIAIPSAQNFNANNKEFVIYESSFSDIIGVVAFNFFLYNGIITTFSIVEFGIEMGIILIVSILSTFLLSILLNRIQHHVKFVPILILVILIYAIAKLYHLPGLIFVLIFGLLNGNLHLLKSIPWLSHIQTDHLKQEVHKFREIAAEGAFIIRALFFLVFGYLINVHEVLNTDSLLWSIGIVISVFILRAIQLYIFKLPIMPLIFIAPRGLITILLFLSIPEVHKSTLLNNSVVIQVILLTAGMLMIGSLLNKQPSMDNE